MRPPRLSYAGGHYHITTRCNNREFLFKDSDDFKLYLNIVKKGKEKYDVKIYAYALMHNHVHLLACTPEKGNVSEFMNYVNGQFARKYNKIHNRSGHFWGERFHSTIVEADSQLFNTIAYIELNAVKAKIVKSPKNWKWSSYNAHAFGEFDPILDEHPQYTELGNDKATRQKHHRQMIQDYMEKHGLVASDPISKGIITGTESFVNSLLEKFKCVHKFYEKRKIFDHGNECFCLLRIPNSQK